MDWWHAKARKLISPVHYSNVQSQMVEQLQNQILRERKCRVSLLTHILELLKDDPALRQILLQKLLDNENSGDDSGSVKLATKPRICDLKDSQDPYDMWKNKGKRKEPTKVMTFGKKQGHYLNKIFILQVKRKLSAYTILYSLPKNYYSSAVPTRHCSWTVCTTQISQELHSVKRLPFDECNLAFHAW